MYYKSTSIIISYLVFLSDRIRLCTTTAQEVSANVLGSRQIEPWTERTAWHFVYPSQVRTAGNIDPLDVIDRLARNHVVWILLYNILVPV